MVVGVGSFSDPEVTQLVLCLPLTSSSSHNIWQELQGLSHYLEHMLFMGSEAFPDENEYDSFLSSHGGSSNAYTEMASPNSSSLAVSHTRVGLLLHLSGCSLSGTSGGTRVSTDQHLCRSTRTTTLTWSQTRCGQRWSALQASLWRRCARRTRWTVSCRRLLAALLLQLPGRPAAHRHMWLPCRRSSYLHGLLHVKLWSALQSSCAGVAASPCSS